MLNQSLHLTNSQKKEAVKHSLFEKMLNRERKSHQTCTNSQLGVDTHTHTKSATITKISLFVAAATFTF